MLKSCNTIFLDFLQCWISIQKSSYSKHIFIFLRNDFNNFSIKWKYIYILFRTTVTIEVMLILTVHLVILVVINAENLIFNNTAFIKNMFWFSLILYYNFEFHKKCVDIKIMRISKVNYLLDWEYFIIDILNHGI